MHDCKHDGKLRFARRNFENGTVHYCVQCLQCGEVVKHKRFDYRPFIRHEEIPTGFMVHDFNNWGASHD